MKKWQIIYTMSNPVADIVEAADVELGQYWAKLYNGTSDVVWASPIERVLSITQMSGEQTSRS